ncbi:MAG: ABC transporter ATP-binding protein [Actinobacteria bacterium]|nr:ABC transporter ATP-binding protein [Actinomycetota bacterium]
MTTLLETDGLTRRFGGLDAVSDVSVTVEQNSVVGFIGPNGAGKTTFINVVTGFLKPSAGRVVFDGNDVTGNRPWDVARAGVSRTFQIAKPFRDLTVRENVALGSMFGPGNSRSVAASLTDADEVLERVGLSERAEARPGELPIADTKRLELAKALAMKPRLLLLDEVMAGLRPAEIDNSIDLIRSLQKDGLTIVVIEHVMKAILAVSDKVIVLHEGKRLAEGPPKEIASDDRVIEAYLGERYAKRVKEGGDA